MEPSNCRVKLKVAQRGRMDLLREEKRPGVKSGEVLNRPRKGINWRRVQPLALRDFHM